MSYLSLIYNNNLREIKELYASGFKPTLIDVCDAINSSNYSRNYELLEFLAKYHNIEMNIMIVKATHKAQDNFFDTYE